MDIEWSLLLPLLVILVLTVLFTGPGMWSETVGWWWLRRSHRPGRRR